MNEPTNIVELSNLITKIAGSCRMHMDLATEGKWTTRVAVASTVYKLRTIEVRVQAFDIDTRSLKKATMLALQGLLHILRNLEPQKALPS